jgi:ribosomal protein S18 acetylase RimI-like enzyme
MTVRRAVVSDVPIVFDLLRAGFGERYLGLTIYRAPQSSQYLRTLVVSEPESTRHDLFVEESAGTVRGFYDAARADSYLFLNYIAVDPASRSLGLGALLLEHFERTALDQGYTQTALDVFASNDRVLSWYLRAGYTEIGRTHLLFIPTANAEPIEPLTMNESARRNALEEESRRGFSRVLCYAGEAELHLGLIAGEVSKILSRTRIDLEKAIRGAAASFRDREGVIAADEHPVPALEPFIVETSVRMTKSIGDRKR